MIIVLILINLIFLGTVAYCIFNAVDEFEQVRVARWAIVLGVNEAVLMNFWLHDTGDSPPIEIAFVSVLLFLMILGMLMTLFFALDTFGRIYYYGQSLYEKHFPKTK